MYSLQQATTIRDRAKVLRAEGLSVRQVADRLGVSRATLNRLLKGYIPGEKYREQKARTRARKELELDPTKPVPVNPNSEVHSPGSLAHSGITFARCKGCGAKVQTGVACLACSQKVSLAASFDCYLREMGPLLEMLRPSLDSFPASPSIFSQRSTT